MNLVAAHSMRLTFVSTDMEAILSKSFLKYAN